VSESSAPPSGLNVRAWREATSLPTLLVGVLLASAMCALALHPRSAGWLGLESRAPAAVFAAWPLTYAFAFAMRDRIDRRAGRWAVLLLVVHGAFLWSTFGACSSVALGVGWCFFLLMPPCWGHIFPHNRALLVGTIVAPPLQRALFTHATARSVAVAAGMGLLVALAYWTFSLRHARKLAAERRSLSREALGASTVDGTAALHVAMGLHDRLSGAVMLARAQTRAADAREILDAAESLSRHARAVLEGARFTRDVTASTLRESLEDFALHVGVALQIELRARPDATDAALEDVGQILVELLANEARHGGGEARVVIEIDRAAARVRFRSAAPIPSSGSGRGLRNIALRATARGGEASFAKDGEIEVVLPLESHATVLLLEALVHFGLPVLAWLVSRDAIVTAIFAGASMLLGVIQAATMIRIARDRRAERVRRRSSMEEAARPAFLVACEELTPVLDELSRAVERGDAETARTVIDVVAERLAAILLAFETAARDGDGGGVRAQLISAAAHAEAQPAQPATDP
jgi:hypothetical protein